MKTVFIATDFSPAAHNAASYGINLAVYLGAKIVLFNAYDVPVSFPDYFVDTAPDSVKKNAESELLREVYELRKFEMQPIEILAVQGNSGRSIIENAKAYEDCLIICGMKGAGKIRKKLMGSTATFLSANSTLPVLVVPEAAMYLPIRNIALAAGYDAHTDTRTIDMLESLGKRYGAKVFIVRVLKKHEQQIAEVSYRSERISEKLSPLVSAYAFPQSSEVSDALEKFIIDNDIQLLALITHHHNFFEQIFKRSESKKMIFHSSIPLLLLPEKKQF